MEVDLYGADDGDEAWIPHVGRDEALTMAGTFLDEPAAEPCFLRLAAAEEAEQRGWDAGGVLTCPADHPDAVPGWHVFDKREVSG